MILKTYRIVAGLDEALRTLFFTTLIFRTGTMAYPFLAAYLLLSGGFDTAQVGAAVACFGVGALAADLAASVLLGRIGARTVMLGGLVLNAAVLAVTPLLHQLLWIIPAVVVWGFAYEVVTPASYSATIDGSAPAERKVAFSCYRLAINLGMAVGPIAGGLLFAVSPRAMFWTNAVCVLAAAGFLMLRTKNGGPPARSARAAERAFAGARPLRDHTRFWTIFGLSLPIQLAYSLPSVFASTYVIVGLGMPSYWAGIIFTVNAAGIVLFEVPLNAAMTRWRNLPTLLLGYGLAGAGFLLMGLFGSGPALVLATLVWTAGEIVVFPGLLHYVSGLAPSGSAADRNMSLYSTGVNVAFILAPQLALLLSGPGHPGAPWAVAGAAVCVAWLLLIAASRSPYTWHDEHTSHDEQPSPPPSHKEVPEPCKSAT
ncbi:MFS transporter [Streptomyces caniferus]|uniref:MFS transporter n=1 Tax=Streptomyces caniferus TaxID=285557 RepID=A0A640S9Y5_9ACTN|nr:MFS transporter [Streptomyces caniferus]GFE07241.1 MFS transporter [Streptomyces caniferus]